MNEIEKMATIIRENASKCLQSGYVCTIDDDVVALHNAGYGDVKQAVRDFAEKLKKGVIIMGDYCEPMVKISKIDKLVKEVCGE